LYPKYATAVDELIQVKTLEILLYLIILYIIMAFVFDYNFNQSTRMGYDRTDFSQHILQNSEYANYMLDGFRPACPLSNAIEFATSQPNINFTGSFQTSVGGSNISENSQLLINDLSRSKCRISLSQRPYSTVPYLGRGKCDPMLESQIQQGDFANNKKSINPSSEVSYIQYAQTPLLPTVKATISNPANLIESNAADGWIRGGLPSRELARDKEYNDGTNYRA
jgi:hypothetical protein